MVEYASNSHKSKETQLMDKNAERKVEKVVKGSVKTRDNKGRKFADIFISEDAANVKSYVFMDVLVPAIKKAISDIVTNGIDMILYGGTGGGNRAKPTSKVSYRSYYEDRSEPSRYSGRGRFDYDDIIFESRIEAENVRKQMIELIESYGFVTVSDMYDMAGLTAPYTGNNYGWMNLRSSDVVHVRDGYIIRLPKASPID